MAVAAPSASCSSPSRTVLVAHDRAGLERGLVQLVPELRGRACRLARDPATAEDLVQDTIERALKFAAQYERGTNLRAWVYQILFSVFVTRYRRARREKNALRVLGSDPCAWTIPEAFPASPETSVSLSRRTRAELEALPDTFKAVLELVDLAELTYREAAEQLGVPVGTVMSRLHRGRKLLAAQMEGAVTLEAAAPAAEPEVPTPPASGVVLATRAAPKKRARTAKPTRATITQAFAA